MGEWGKENIEPGGQRARNGLGVLMFSGPWFKLCQVLTPFSASQPRAISLAGGSYIHNMHLGLQEAHTVARIYVLEIKCGAVP